MEQINEIENWKSMNYEDWLKNKINRSILTRGEWIKIMGAETINKLEFDWNKE